MKQSSQITSCILIYNVECSKCPTFTTIYNQIDIKKLLIFDNSTNEEILYKNSSFYKENKIKYYCFNENVGLAKAFNTLLKVDITTNWITFFDQDSTIPDNFFEKLENSILENSAANLHAPMVLSGTYMMSPRKFRYNIVGKKIKNLNEGVYENITVVNSGMTINTEIFYQLGGYNEKIFLDYLDHDLVSRYLKLNEKIAIFPSEITQMFSSHTEISEDIDTIRLKIFARDILEYGQSRGVIQSIYVRILILKRILKLSLKYKKLSFLNKFYYLKGSIR